MKTFGDCTHKSKNSKAIKNFKSAAFGSVKHYCVLNTQDLVLSQSIKAVLYFELGLILETFNIRKRHYFIGNEAFSPFYNNLCESIQDIESILINDLIAENRTGVTIFKNSICGNRIGISKFMNIFGYKSFAAEILRNDSSGVAGVLIALPKIDSIVPNFNFVSVKDYIFSHQFGHGDRDAVKIVKVNTVEDSGKIFVKNLVNNLSHEIRSPLNSFSGFLNILRQVEMLEPEEFKLFSEIVVKSGQRLTSTLENITEFTMLQTGLKTPNYSMCSITETIKEFYERMLPMFEEKNLSFKLKINGKRNEYFTDETLIRSILSRLLNNALKFTTQGEVVLALTKKLHGFIVQVEDSGIGINNNEIKNTLEPFFQVESGYSRSYDGLGLGLTLSNLYAQLLGGQMNISSVAGKGTKVTVFFPVSN